MKKALIAMAVHDTDENQRTKYTEETLKSLSRSLWADHQLIVVDNGSCKATKDLLEGYIFRSETMLAGNFGPKIKGMKVITLPDNIGTARAINRAWQLREPGQHCIKIDNDVVIHSDSWVEQMIEVIERQPKIGIVGLKRKDCRQTTWDDDPEYRSELIMLPHEPGQRWINVEKTRDIMGTCTMFNSALLDKIGFMYQKNLYGFDDVFASWRSNIAGFWNVHLSHIEIDHIDTGENLYQKWKEKHSSEAFAETVKEVNEMLRGERDIFIPFY